MKYTQKQQQQNILINNQLPFNNLGLIHNNYLFLLTKNINLNHLNKEFLKHIFYKSKALLIKLAKLNNLNLEKLLTTLLNKPIFSKGEKLLIILIQIKNFLLILPIFNPQLIILIHPLIKKQLIAMFLIHLKIDLFILLKIYLPLKNKSINLFKTHIMSLNKIKNFSNLFFFLLINHLLKNSNVLKLVISK